MCAELTFLLFFLFVPFFPAEYAENKKIATKAPRLKVSQKNFVDLSAFVARKERVVITADSPAGEAGYADIR